MARTRRGGTGIVAWTLFSVWILSAVILALTSPDPPERWRLAVVGLLALVVIIAFRGPWPRV